MLVKILSHGSGKSRGGTSAKEYLLGKDNKRLNACLLKGDPDITTEIINGLKFAKTYTSGGIHFGYDEAKKLTDKDKQDIIESFEKAMFPNLEPSQFSGYWVEHTDKVNEKGERRLELNFIYASVDLESGKALPVYYHANDKKLTSNWRDYTNIKYDLTDPLELQRQQTIKIARNLPSHKKEILQSVHELITAKVANGDIKDRADIVGTLQDASVELTGKPFTNKYITIKDPDGNGKNIRLKGEIYDDPKWTVSSFIKKLRDGETADVRGKSERLEEAEKRLRKSVTKRAERFEKRFSAVATRSAERAERLEAENIGRAYNHIVSDSKQSQRSRAESDGARAKRKSLNATNRPQDRAEPSPITRRAKGNKQQSFSTNENAIRTSSNRDNSIISSRDTVTVSNTHNALLHSQTKTIFLVDIGLDFGSVNNVWLGTLDNSQQEKAGGLSSEQVPRTDNFRQLERDTNATTGTGTRATDSTQDSRTATLEQLTKELERTSKSVCDFAEQLRPSPFKRSIRKRERKNDRNRQEDGRYQYTYDRSREREREANERLNSAFRQLEGSTKQAILLDERIIEANQEIERQRIEANQEIERQRIEAKKRTEQPIRSRGFRP